MCSSPTLLINGVGLFVSVDDILTFSCRVYGVDDNPTNGAPSVEQLRQVLQKASNPEELSPS